MQNRFRTLGIACGAVLLAIGVHAVRSRRPVGAAATADMARDAADPSASSRKGVGPASTPLASPVDAEVSATGSMAGSLARVDGVARAPAPFIRPADADSRAFASVNTAAVGSDPAGSMLLRQGQASLEVRHVDDAVARVRQAAARFGGFVANATIRGGRDETRAAALEVRVPSAQFDALVAALGGLGRLESVTASAQDAGDEYVDLSARAANARHFEARLTEMLASRTGKLSDVLSMEQELARVREQIERYEGRIRYLERRASLSTLSIALHEPLPLIERPHAGPLAEAAARAWERAVGVLGWCIAALGLLVPGAILLGALALVMRRAARKPVLVEGPR